VIVKSAEKFGRSAIIGQWVCRACSCAVYISSA